MLMLAALHFEEKTEYFRLQLQLLANERDLRYYKWIVIGDRSVNLLFNSPISFDHSKNKVSQNLSIQ